MWNRVKTEIFILNFGITHIQKKIDHTFLNEESSISKKCLWTEYRLSCEIYKFNNKDK